MAEEVCPVERDSNARWAVLEGTRDGDTERSDVMPRARWLAVVCTVPGLLFVATYTAWKFHVNQPPAPVLPPAGVTIKGPTSFRFAVMGDTRGTPPAGYRFASTAGRQKSWRTHDSRY